MTTQFDPDEFWQGLEPAHRLVFGNGHLTWEYQSSIALRSWTHPMILAAPWAVARGLGIVDDGETSDGRVVSLLPRVFVQAVLCALADDAIGELVEKLKLGEPSETIRRARRWAAVLAATSWFLCYAGVRTYSNSMEAALTMIVLGYFWPWNYVATSEKSPYPALALSLAALTVAVRPSALATWLYLGALLLGDAYARGGLRACSDLVLKCVVPIGLVSCATLCAIDSFGYGRLGVFTPWNFLRLNLLRSDIAASYGTHPWHWYVTQGFPAVLGILVPLFILCVHRLTVATDRVSYAGVRFQQRALGLIGFGVAASSLSAHKEFRFLLPLLGPAIALAGIEAEKRFGTVHLPSNRLVLLVICVAGAIPAVFLGGFHQRAPVAATLHLSTLANVTRLDVLTPCHATPLYSHLHRRRIQARFLECSPRLEELRELPGYNTAWLSESRGLDESTRFKREPGRVVARRAYPEGPPSHVLTGSKFLAEVQGALKARESEFHGASYRVCGEFAWAQSDLGERIVLLCRESGV